MRFSPRRRSDEDAPPARGPVAAYAGILDGHHLWLLLEGADRGEGRGAGRGADSGPATLHDDASGTTLPLTGEITDLLGGLPATEATYDVRLAGRPVWGPPPGADDPIRIPLSPDGRTQLGLVRTEAGHLQVTRRAVTPTALLEAVEVRGGDAHLTLRPPDGVRPGTHLLLLDAEDQLLDQLPVTAHDGRIEALVGVADLPAGHFGVVRLVLGTEDSWVRIRRRRSDLTDPHHAVLLPELSEEADESDGGDRGDRGDESAGPRARFRWNPDSWLVLRVLDPAEQTGPGATVTPMVGQA